MTPATHYFSASKGPVEIAAMPLRHAQNSLFKLIADRTDDSRDAEILGLREHVERLEIEMAEKEAANG